MQRLPLSYPGSVGECVFHCTCRDTTTACQPRWKSKLLGSSALELLKTVIKGRGKSGWCSCVELGVEVILGFKPAVENTSCS